MGYLSKITLAGALAGVIMTAAPASAAVETFASYTQKTLGNTIQWSKGAHTLTKVGTQNVSFNYLLPQISYLNPLDAKFTLSLTGTGPATNAGGYLIQSNLSGSFSFIYQGSGFTIGSTFYGNGTNLLSGTLTQATIGGQSGGTSAGVSASTGSGGALTYTSDVLTFANNNFDFALSLTQVNPFLFADAGQALNSFRAASTGSFSSDPRPTVNALPPVPEPATWAMMIAGFGLVGGSLRQRRLARTFGPAAI